MPLIDISLIDRKELDDFLTKYEKDYKDTIDEDDISVF
jgi:hypothetical protein